MKNDFQLYEIPQSEKDKKMLASKLIYITLQDEQLVEAITVEDGYLDYIMVAPPYQGNGYGKEIT